MGQEGFGKMNRDGDKEAEAKNYISHLSAPDPNEASKNQPTSSSTLKFERIGRFLGPLFSDPKMPN